jgi:dihydrofolate reductase
MILSIIAAVGRNGEIGRNGDLLCRLPADMKRFREITLGHTVIMGRKTFVSLPEGPLPDRRNVIISRNRDFSVSGAEVYFSLDAAFAGLHEEKEVYVIGGGEVYAQTISVAKKLYITEIDADFPDADTFFPDVACSAWRETGRLIFPACKGKTSSFAFADYERI